MTRTRELPVFVSLAEAADVASVSTRTIRRRISDGTIPAYHLGNGAIRLRLDDVLAAFKRIPSARQ